MKACFIIICAALSLFVCSCSVNVPEKYTQDKTLPTIYPEYVDVTVPSNIAPLTFTIDLDGEDFVTTFSTKNGVEVAIGGKDVCPSMSEWEELKNGGDMEVKVYVKKADNWTLYKPFHIYVSADKIDPYISYRLISPSYVTYEDLTICQRNLENYDEEIIYGNMINSTEKDGQCINCHSFQNYNPERMQFHCRQHLGGTVLAYDGNVQKVSMSHLLKAHPGDTVKSAGVYPAWHPTEKLIAYSSNSTGQSFHTNDPQKIEVQDTYSDLILYDIDANKVIALERDTSDMDCFPWWSPDGKYLYYCSAHYERRDSTGTQTKEFELITNYQDIKYNLYRRSFNLEKKQFGERELVYDAEAQGRSATLPRISPDGRWLMFTEGQFGVFHIWHSSADLYLMDLKSKQVRNVKELNSDNVESYHSWSSNGRWVIFSSRRTDGNFTRPFIAHVDKDGKFSKPFELPQANPNYHREMLRSYNIPEFMTGPVSISPQQFADVVKGDAHRVDNAE